MTNISKNVQKWYKLKAFEVSRVSHLRERIFVHLLEVSFSFLFHGLLTDKKFDKL